MIEILVEKKGLKLFSIGIKPMKSLKRKNRKKLNRKRNIDYLYLDYNSSDITQFKDEHDALILCKKTEKIKRLDE